MAVLFAVFVAIAIGAGQSSAVSANGFVEGFVFAHTEKYLLTLHKNFCQAI